MSLQTQNSNYDLFTRLRGHKPLITQVSINTKSPIAGSSYQLFSMIVWLLGGLLVFLDEEFFRDKLP